MTDTDYERLVDVELTSDERRVLAYGVTQWGGPGHASELLARAIGFPSEDDMDTTGYTLFDRLVAREPLSRRDWSRVLLSSEVAFASDYGAGVDWSTVTGFSDAATIALLRSLQYKLVSIKIPIEELALPE